MDNAHKTFPEGEKLYFFPDLSHHTLALRKTLRSLLGALHNMGTTYHWGFPFRLTATKEGISATKDDLPKFMEMLNLSDVDFPDWRGGRTLTPAHYKTRLERTN